MDLRRSAQDFPWGADAVSFSVSASKAMSAASRARRRASGEGGGVAMRFSDVSLSSLIGISQKTAQGLFRFVDVEGHRALLHTHNPGRFGVALFFGVDQQNGIALLVG